MKGCEVLIGNISKAFGPFRALEQADLCIKRGEFFSILGPSGCGKTTLLRIIAGFERPDTGQIRFDGTDVTDLPPDKRQSNTVFQNYALFPHLSVFENIAFPLRLQKIPEAEIRRRVAEYVHLVQLEGHENKKPALLSGGQKQRVAIARALINEPRVLLLDEPLSALDAKLRQNLLVELDAIHDKTGITFVYVTHDQSEALSVSDHIAVMNAGRILQTGTPFEIYESPATEFVAQFIGETNSFVSTVAECRPHNGEFMVRLSVPELESDILVTDNDRTEPGQNVCFTVRPEKIRITTEEPEAKDKSLNIFRGIVAEPVYSGFQSKFYVRLDNGTVVKVFKQHQNYMEEGPEIGWKDTVYISWSADDGYIVEEINR